MVAGAKVTRKDSSGMAGRLPWLLPGNNSALQTLKDPVGNDLVDAGLCCSGLGCSGLDHDVLLDLQWLGCVCSQTRLGPCPRQRGRQVPWCGKRGSKSQPKAGGKPKTWSCTERFPSPCTRQEQGASARLGFLIQRKYRSPCHLARVAAMNHRASRLLKAVS